MTEPSPEDILRMGRAAFTPPTQAVPTPLSESPTGDPQTEEATIASPSAQTSPVAPMSHLIGAGRPFGRYRLLQELGKGGMGVVWKAFDTDLQRIVALKMIRSAEFADETEVERFLREARAAARLRHPHIVPVHDVGRMDGQHYFTSDFIDGVSLEQLRKAGTVPPRDVLRIVRAVAEALQYAHGQGIVHRDVKPANILLDRQAQPFLTDFGLAKEVGMGTTGPTLSGEILGTPPFMSPEQAGGSVHAMGPASDQWSLGVTLYLLLTGVLPFTGESLPELVYAILEEDPLPPTVRNPKLHRDVQTIVLKTLEKDPLRRYASLGDLAADLGRFLEGEPIAARPVAFLERWRRRASKHRVGLIAAACVAALGLGAWAWAWHAGRGTEQVAQEKASLERRLHKVQAIARVLDRWSALYGPLLEIEKCARDDTLSAEEKRRRLDGLWAPVADFMNRTPADAPSQATMLALAGWAMGTAGRAEEGIEAMRRAQGIDAEVPYGFLMEALVHVELYVYALPIPRRQRSEAGEVFGKAPPEPPELAAERQAILPLLRKAREASFWGAEGAEEVASALAGIEKLSSGDYAAVEGAVTRALAAPELRVQHSLFRLARAQARYYGHDLRGATEDLDALLEAFPRAVILLLHRADFMVTDAMGRVARGEDAEETLAGARAVYDRVLEIQPGCGEALCGRADLRLDLGDLRGALTDFEQAVEQMPDVAAAHAGLGAAWFQLGEFDKAASCFGEAISLDPDDTASYINRSLARRELGQVQGAIDDATKAIELDPRSASAYNNRATARMDAGDTKGALADLDEAIRIGPVPAATWFNRARVRDELGDLDGAMADFTKAIDLDKGLAAAWYQRAAVRIAKRDPKGAIADLTEAVRLDPSYEEAWFVRAYIRMMEGDRVGAIGDFKKALEVSPPDWRERSRAQELLDRLERP